MEIREFKLKPKRVRLVEWDGKQATGEAICAWFRTDAAKRFQEPELTAKSSHGGLLWELKTGDAGWHGRAVPRGHFVGIDDEGAALVLDPHDLYGRFVEERS